MEKKNQNRKKYTQGEYLPDILVKKIKELILDNKSLQYTSKNNFLQCLAIIYYYQVTKNAGLNYYVPLGSDYWKKVYGHNYHKSVIEPLLEFRLIESFDFGYRSSQEDFSNKYDGKVGIRYRITPNLLNDQFEFISYIQKRKNVLTAEERILLGKNEFKLPEIPDLNFCISIDKNKASNWIEANAEQVCAEFLKSDHVDSLPDKLKIEYHEDLQNGSFNVRYSTVEWAKFIADSRGQSLFYFKDTFYIADIDKFLVERIPVLTYHYKQGITKVGAIKPEEKRSPVTLRLYSHLTNFPSRILQFININNKTVVQLDLRTSQFLIFANLINVFVLYGEEHLLSLFHQTKCKTYLRRFVKILKDHQKQLPVVGVNITDRNSGEHSSSDVTRFIRDVFYSDFYDVVAYELGMKERSLAKTALFKLLFKKTNRPDVS